MRRFGLLALVLLLTATPSFAKDTVVIYTAIEPEQVTDYMTAAGFPSTAVNGAIITVTNLSSHAWVNPADATSLDRFRVTVEIPAGAPYQSLQWSPVSTITGTTSMTVSVDWLSANDSLVIFGSRSDKSVSTT